MKVLAENREGVTYEPIGKIHPEDAAQIRLSTEEGQAEERLWERAEQISDEKNCRLSEALEMAREELKL